MECISYRKKLKRGDDIEPYTPLDFETKMTEKNLIPFFEKMIDKNNFIKVILIPERTKNKNIFIQNHDKIKAGV